MNELDRIYNTMQDNFKEIFSRLDDIDKKQVENSKDIEFIKKELNGKMDQRIKTAIDFSILKEKYKSLTGLIGGVLGAIGFLATIIKFFVG